MDFKIQKPFLTKATLFLAASAWFLFQSYASYLHAEDYDHSDTPSHHCIACSYGALDDVDNPPQELPLLILNFAEKLPFSINETTLYAHWDFFPEARAPPCFA